MPASPARRDAAGQAPAELSAREVEILQLVADGLTNRQIGAYLELTEERVKTHLHSVLEKLGAAGRANAVAWGFRLGLIL